MALLDFLSQAGQGIDQALTGASNPFGLAPLPGQNPEQMARMPYLDLGMGVLANSTQRPLQALGGSFQNMRQQGMDMGTKRLWAQQVQSQLQDSQEERDSRKKLTSALQGLLSPVQQTGGGAAAAAPSIAETPSAGPGAPFAQPIPQPMEQGAQAGGGQQFSPQQLFQAKYWLSAGQPQKAMEALFKSNPTNWQTVTTEDGVFAFNPETRQMERLGERPTRNEGEGRGFLQEDKLRDDYSKQADPFSKRRESYQGILAAYQGAQSSPDNPGPADIAMIYQFMKMLDPGSTVMQGEYANAQNAGGIPQSVITTYNNLLKGDKLSPHLRDAFMDQATAQYDAALNSYSGVRKTFQGLATSNQLDPDRVAPDYTYGVKPFRRGNPNMTQFDIMTGGQPSGSNAPDAGWTTLPNGVRIRQK